jgi:hypothetical protein
MIVLLFSERYRQSYSLVLHGNQIALIQNGSLSEGPMAERPFRPQEMKAVMVICKNPFCMRFSVVPPGSDFEGTAKLRLTCPECGHEHEYQRKDLHLASGSKGTAINPV